MTSDDQGDKTVLSVEEIAAEARPLAAESDFGKMAERFLATLHSWAAPSAVLCLCKDAAADGGWRSVSELALGPVSVAFERSIVKLIEDSAPGSLSRPVPVRPRDDTAGGGVKVRDNWLVPWAFAESCGYLFLRGISRPISNFGDAVALLSQPLWSRLPGGSAATGAPPAAGPLPTLVEQARLAAERLTEALRAERLTPPSGEPGRESPDSAKRLAALESERDQANAEAAALKARLAEAEGRAKSPVSNDQLNTLRRRVNELEGQAGELSERLSEANKARREIESERDGARAEAVALRNKLAEAAARPQPGAAPDQDESAKRVSELEARASELADKLAAAEKVRGEAESDRDAARRDRDEARSEASALKGRLEQAQAKADAPNEELAAAQKRIGELEARATELSEKQTAAEKARAELESERDAARREREALETRLAEAQAKASSSEPATDVEALKKQASESETRATELSEKLAAAEKARAELESERDAARSEAASLKSKIDTLEAKSDEDMHWEPVASEEVETLQRQMVELDTKYSDAERGRAEAVAERDRLRAELEAAKTASATEGAEAGAGGEGELSRAKAEANRLWQTVESLQQQLQKEAERLGELATENTRLTQAADEAKRERDAAQASLIAASEGVQDAERRERTRTGQRGKLIESLQATSDALRRTPFVPPALRIAFSGVEEVLAGEGELRERTGGARTSGRVLFLDRDIAGVERIANELEASGLEVLIAHYPEEVGFFLKTPDARKLTAMVCDVMAFRGDQNLLDLFRAWRQDQSNLALLLSFKADSPAETEKAQRIPVVLTAGYLTRPLDRQAVLDAVGMIARRQMPR